MSEAEQGLARIEAAARELLTGDLPLTERLTTLGLQAGALLAAVVAGLLLHAVTFGIVSRIFRRRERDAEDSEARREEHDAARLVDRLRRPSRWVIVLVVLLFAVSNAVPFGDATRDVLRHLLAILLVLSATWLLVRAMDAIVGGLLARYDVTSADNLRARKVHTQFRVFSRIGAAILWLLGIAATLMTFPGVRQFGASLLASAGLAGLVIGLAAQRVIGNFLAGIQIAVTQPIRLDDAVVIDGEWGWVEEITSTYVVVRIWDQRRLIVPFGTLLEQPFQNWTRNSADLIGSVMLYTDYRVPLAPLREELKHAVEDAGGLWDGRVCVLQVIDCTPQTLQLRALVSARSSPAAWDLRCFVRERLVSYLQREFPQALPLSRVELQDRRDVASHAQALGPGGDPGAGAPGSVDLAEATGGVPDAPDVPASGGERP